VVALTGQRRRLIDCRVIIIVQKKKKNAWRSVIGRDCPSELHGSMDVYNMVMHLEFNSWPDGGNNASRIVAKANT